MLDRNRKIVICAIGVGCATVASTLIGRAIKEAHKKSNKEDIDLHASTEKILPFITNYDKFKAEVDEDVQKAVARHMDEFSYMIHPVYIKKAISEGCPVLEFIDMTGATHLYKYVEKDDKFTHNCIEDI